MGGDFRFVRCSHATRKIDLARAKDAGMCVRIVACSIQGKKMRGMHWFVEMVIHIVRCPKELWLLDVARGKNADT